ncbi:hypothetical protein, variant [Capsaspora owczarzaki ATCC 30864]|uniref:Alpha 1,4-glycosyltransferase domain-containing protein n=2 Tax=Capsaspora owczarzaki (strain ATCC 30864) TaxID=595528 RepID=A0A0D2WRR2_CAPO3|nr:hypothetical protein, variant [Capsaspora owczarzaki ATCC 30864]KJE94650.1 hypothetical protein CAOG_005265 [Capsaspora owczarzaki ATCC 30864]|eukprot:XP_011270491.1 hypothetical protein, variant [Capsaspora owczarzaki ATCC 30864]
MHHQCEVEGAAARRLNLRRPPPPLSQEAISFYESMPKLPTAGTKPAWARVEVHGFEVRVPAPPAVNISSARRPLGAFVPREELLQTTGLQCLPLQEHQSLAELFHGFWDGPMNLTLPPLYLSAISTVFSHHPDSTYLVHSNTLPLDQFDELRAMGFDIAVVRFDALRAVTFGNLPGRNWLRHDRVQHAGHRNVRSHMSDLIRTILMYQCGGIYMDLDSVLLRPLHFLNRAFTMEPMRPDHLRVQYTRMDGVSSLLSCSEVIVTRPQAVDEGGAMILTPYVVRGDFGLVPGLLAFGPRDPFIFMMMQVFEEPYNPDCFSCVGPVAVNKAYMASTAAERLRLQVYPADAMFGPFWRGVMDKFDEFWQTTTDERGQALVNDAIQFGFTQHLYGGGHGAPSFQKDSFIHRLVVETQLIPLPDLWQ